ncbi:aldo/keto reductase [Kitasatospora viridis]|uniref:Aryl-alcohol dehydrogenase-like predicted oxidoreductase n=1 Tax=Kitasatospora viridis TaxID=281105 RepID=A0A561ULK1_9ACTN|nr:aldo/keto reductase [Kitasatospora viridis]TWG00214.1 aryl-alcohol dehydrogenase-like predicted oxidoreductase [Kitasatospora viridis]
MSTTLPTVQLGTDGPVVGKQGLGCMGMSEFYGPTDTTEALATLDAALEAGVTLFDTADIYGSGANEELIGPFVRANRDRVVLATKFAIERKAEDPAYRGVRNDPEYIRSAVDASLKRLGIDVIDLYYMHRRNREVPLAESIGAMAELVQAGKVRHLGLSEVTGSELREAHAVHPIAAVQSEWSLFTRTLEQGVVPVAAELGIGLVPYSPLGRGFLTGNFPSSGEMDASDFRRSQPRFSGEAGRANAELIAPIQRIAAARGVTAAQVALAWLHGRAEVFGLTAVVPIPGTRKRTRLAENVAGAGLELTAQELAELEPIAGQVTGDRYADMSLVRDGKE